MITFSITDKEIDCASLREKLGTAEDGAVLVFEGIVRNHNEGKAVRTLFYEACESLACAEAERIMTEAVFKFGLNRIVCVHRTGHLNVGDAAVFVGVSTGHRGEAFAGCRYVIDEIKHRLPIWKKEHYQDGSHEWVNCSHHEHNHQHSPKSDHGEVSV
ncbi:MAG: molybdenum cofactor biosynthesis protein MoaE [Candidatus Obscuribacterales bacterium]|nr:molybdenum cofactor biosynthesis protein MoaE [Candidatus Obscuribacterales bacterium]